MNREIFLVRHGESKGNIDSSEYSRVNDKDIKLTKHGRRQAQEAGSALSGAGLLNCYCSTYKRAIDTLSEMSKHGTFLKSVTYDPRLIEINFCNKSDENSIRHIFNGISDNGLFHFRNSYGESCMEVYSRIRQFLYEVVRSDPSSKVLIVSHGITINVILMVLLGLAPDEFDELKYPKNASILKLCGDKLGEYSLEIGSLVKRKKHDEQSR